MDGRNAKSVTVPYDRVWMVQLPEDAAEAFRAAWRLMEANEHRCHLELRREPGYGIEVIEVHRTQTRRAKPQGG